MDKITVKIVALNSKGETLYSRTLISKEGFVPFGQMSKEKDYIENHIPGMTRITFDIEYAT